MIPKVKPKRFGYFWLLKILLHGTICSINLSKEQVLIITALSLNF